MTIQLKKVLTNNELHQKISITGREASTKWSWYTSMEQTRQDTYIRAISNFRLRWEQRFLRWIGITKKGKEGKIVTSKQFNDDDNDILQNIQKEGKPKLAEL